MRFFFLFILLAPLLLAPLLLGQAEAAAIDADVVYVTDELRLGLYRGEDTSGRSIKTLISGARLEILERALMSIRVRTEEGDEGWVKTAYIVNREPARRRVAVLETQLAETSEHLVSRDSELESARADVMRLNAELDEARSGITDLPMLKQENASLTKALNEGGVRVPLFWLAIAAVISLLAGALLGYLWLDRRVRRQFGGVRVY